MAFVATYALTGGATGPVHATGKDMLTLVPVTLTFGGSDTYVTGGYDVVLPDDVAEQKLEAIILTDPFDGTREWRWDGSKTSPKLLAYDAFATEEGNATSIASVVLSLILVLKH